MLAEGTQIGAYSILSKLGSGGMGEVYLARDTRLDRVVAIKALPEELARDSEWLGRFLREAKLLASLNHPNISTLYGIEEVEGSARFLILERVEGQTLAERLRRGAIPVEEALATGDQIAEALEAAHERGVVHRDLKPANIMVTERGRVKVLDFGLARRMGVASAVTVDSMMRTAEGHVSGTPGYMSPEQLLAKPEDQRTDVFAFGCVLYESLSGKRAFDGPTPIDAMAAVLNAEPSWAALPSGVPTLVRELLGRCLQKDPERRVRDMSEVRASLSSIHPDASGPGPGRPGTPNNLPRQGTSFVGREREIGECVGLLGENRLLTLTGIGGCGKSRLMLSVAARVLDQFPDGVWFVDIAPLTDPLRVAEGLVRAIGVREDPTKTLARTLTDHVADRTVLILLDNCEQMLGIAAELAGNILEACRNTRVLATSREAMAIAGEQAYQVPSLSLPDLDNGRDYSSMARSESVRLFVDRARFALTSFELTEGNVRAVGEICRRLDGIPLAIELAAARVKVLSEDQIASKLDDRFRLLTGGSKSALPRHQTLRATMQWSYDLLASDEQRMLRILSVFAGGWTLEAATAVWGQDADEFEVLDVLTRLVDKSLVLVQRKAGAESRYRFLETVRQYALEKLSESPDFVDVRERHLDFVLAFSEAAEPHLTGPGAREWLARIEDEHENILAALSWCERAAQGSEKAMRIGAAVYRFWYVRGYYTLGKETLAAVLAIPGTGSRTIHRGYCLSASGAMAISQGDAASARRLFQEALEIFRERQLRHGEMRALNGLGMAASQSEDFEAGRAYYQECLAVAREIEDVRGMSIALNNLGDIAMSQGDYATATPLLEEALAMVLELGDQAGQRITIFNLAITAFRTGDTTVARRRLLEGLRIAQKLAMKQLAPEAFNLIGQVAVELGEPERAARLFGAADALYEATGEASQPGDARLQEAAEKRVRAELGDREFEAARARGKAMPFESVIDEAVRWLEASGNS